MSRKTLLVLPLALALAVIGKRLVAGPLAGGATLLPSGWRIRPAGRQVAVGSFPLGLVTLSDGSLVVTNNGFGDNGLMGIDPQSATVVWKLQLPAAWLGLARTGGRGGSADTLWASGGNRLYRAVRSGAEWRADTLALADSNGHVFSAGAAVLPGRDLVAVVGNLSDSVY